MWAKAFLKGAMVGAYFGALYIAIGPVKTLEWEKLMASTGNVKLSGQFYR